MDYGREPTEEEMLESILNDPLLADVGAGDDLGIFDVPDYMRRRLEERREAEYVGKHRPCADFDKYAAGFRDIQQGLREGRYRLVKFSETNLKVGRYFVEQGVIGYLAAMEADRRRRGSVSTAAHWWYTKTALRPTSNTAPSPRTSEWMDTV